MHHAASYALALRSQRLGAIGLFPAELGLRAAEVAVRRRLAVDRAGEIEHLAQAMRGEVEVRTHDLRQTLTRQAARAEGLDHDRGRLSHTDRIRHLHFALLGKARGDDVLRDVARGVRRRTVDLRRILARERTAAVTGIAAVGVDDDLATRQAAVAHRATDHEPTGRVDVVLGALVDPLRRQHRLR